MPEQIAELDLSSWAIAVNGAEPVLAETLEKFAKTFAPAGFRKEAFCPAYGMAETTVMVSLTERKEIPMIEFVQRTALEKNRVELAEKESESRTVVGCGQIGEFGTVIRGGRWGYVKLPSSYAPESPYTEAFPGPNPSVDPLVEPFLTVFDNGASPALAASELSRLKNDGKELIQSWINIAGVGATSNPTEFTETLQTLAQQQQTGNPDTAAFLGLWQGEPPASGYPYYLSILPANAANQVCVVEYQRSNVRQNF